MLLALSLCSQMTTFERRGEERGKGGGGGGEGGRERGEREKEVEGGRKYRGEEKRDRGAGREEEKMGGCSWSGSAVNFSVLLVNLNSEVIKNQQVIINVRKKEKK